MKTILVKIPKGFMNTRVTTKNFFVADTNDSANWDTIKFPLPKGKWVILSNHKQDVIIGKVSIWEQMLTKILGNDY